MHAQDVCPGLHHPPRLLDISHKSYCKHIHVMGELDSFHLLLVGVSFLFQTFPKLPVDHGKRRIIDDSGEPRFSDFFQIIIKMDKRIAGQQPEQHRRVPDDRQQLPFSHLHDRLIIVVVAEEGSHGTSSHHPVFSCAERQQQIRSAQRRIFRRHAGANGRPDNMPVNVYPCMQSL